MKQTMLMLKQSW